jgi:hypothetical protein
VNIVPIGIVIEIGFELAHALLHRDGRIEQLTAEKYYH